MAHLEGILDGHFARRGVGSNLDLLLLGFEWDFISSVRHPVQWGLEELHILYETYVYSFCFVCDRRCRRPLSLMMGKLRFTESGSYGPFNVRLGKSRELVILSSFPMRDLLQAWYVGLSV